MANMVLIGRQGRPAGAERRPRSRLLPGVSAFLLTTLWAAAAFGWAFGVCGDSRDDDRGVFPRILSAVEKSDMEFLIHTGDLERHPGTGPWEAFNERTAGFPKPLHLVIGNHEIGRGVRGTDFAAFFGLSDTSYSFRHKDAFFIILDNAEGLFRPSTLSWLEQQLAENPKGKLGIAHLVVAMHIPPLTEGVYAHGVKADYGKQSDHLLTLLRRHGVDLLLCSHEHIQRIYDLDGLKVIVSGGAGAPMMPFQSFGFYRIDLSDGKVKESFVRIPARADDSRERTTR
jgi:3',5'-cyclic AMP phosphodiesterase CpdA